MLPGFAPDLPDVGEAGGKGRGHALVIYGDAGHVQTAAYQISRAARHHPQAPVWVQTVRL